MAVSEKTITDKIERTSLVEELRKEREDNDLAFNTKYSHKEDLENLLKLAENLKKECDREINRIRVYRSLQISGAIIVLIITFYIYYKNFQIDFLFLIVICGLVALAFVVIIYQLIINDIRKQHLADKLALTEVLQLVRETSNIIAEQEEWSVLSRAEFRIRLSRFNLEEKSESAFNFFS